MPLTREGAEDPDVDLVLLSGLRTRVGASAWGRPLSQRAVEKLAAALNRSPMTDFLLALTARGNTHAESFHYHGLNRSNVANLTWGILGNPSPFEMRVQIDVPGHYGQSHVGALTLTLTSRLTAWLQAGRSSEPPPPRSRRLEISQWAGLLDCFAATLASPEVAGPVADLAGIDPIEVRQPRILHVRSGPPMDELLPAQLTAIPDTGHSLGTAMQADPALDLTDPTDRAAQVDLWLAQIGIDAGRLDMERLVAEWRQARRNDG